MKKLTYFIPKNSLTLIAIVFCYNSDAWNLCSGSIIRRNLFAMILNLLQRIPPAFVPKLKNETETGNIVVLQGPTSENWVVKLCSIGTEMEFGQGWEQFVHHNAIELGDFLVFKYISTSYFKVRIFGRSGCEKNGTVFDAEKNNCDLEKRCPDTLPPAGVSLYSVESMDRKLPIYLVSDDEENDNKREAVAENQWKKLKPSSFCPSKSDLRLFL